MRNSILLLLFYILFIGNLSSQSCLPDGINLTTQEQIDAFPFDYPNCTVIEDRLRVRVVGNEFLTNLSGLSQITEVQGDLYLELSSSAATMIDLQDLSNITTIGGSLIILNSGNLENLNGLQNLTSIGGEITIVNNDGLLSLTGLDNLKRVEQRISISSNEKLKNLTGLGGLEYVGGYLNIDVTENFEGFAPLDTVKGINLEGSFIPSTVGLESVTFIKEHLIVIACPLLQNFEGLANLKKIGGNMYIERVHGLTSFSLPNLEEIGGELSVIENESLKNFQGLENLKSINELGISSNPSLINFEGLNALQSINRGAHIIDNEVLLNFDGFDNLIRVENEFEIRNNSLLESITGWDNVEITFDNFVSITQNPMLSVCNALGICSYLTANQPMPNNFLITGNALGCNSVAEVLASCGSQSVCLPDVTQFTTQTQIDDFLIQNPNCKRTFSGITIFGDDITNLDGFINLDSIGGDLEMFNLPNLENLNGFSNLSFVNGRIDISGLTLDNFVGLENLEYAEGLSLTSNSNIDFTGFSGLKRIGNLGLTVQGNPNLISNAGFDNLEIIEGDFYYFDNESLIDMNGFSSLRQIGDDIRFDDGLTTISGLNALESFAGSLAFFTSELTNISGFQNLKKIDGDLFFNSTSFDGLSVTGFNNLDSIGLDFRLENYGGGSLDLSGLNNVKYIGRDFRLENLQLFDQPGPIGGFNQLETIGNEFSMSTTSDINSLSNFQNLRKIKRIKMETNSELTSIEPFANLDFLYLEYLVLEGNPDLEVCANNAICNYLELGGFSLISFNAMGCEDKADIESNCDNLSNGKIRYATFYDINEDGIYQSNEPFLADPSINLQPLGYTLFGNPNSLGRILLPADNYTLSLNIPQDWSATNSSSETVDLTSGVVCDTVLFGIYPTVQQGNMISFVTSPPTRCNEFITFEVTAKNVGTTTIDGWLWLNADNNIQDVQTIDPPNTTSSANEFGWMIEGLAPGGFVSKQISLKIPGPNDFPIGQNLVFKSFVNFDNNGVIQKSDEFEYLAELRCAYDPNDKLVNPSREGNFTQFDENLTYTIRFQNTGNDVANDVAIRDFIDDNLDLSTFQILGSSHYENLSTTIEDRLITFEFEDIFLPDSTSNLEESNGYVMFSIQPIVGNLSEFSNINNQASIFFDFNPPIVTNTALNVMVSSIVDEDNDGFFVFQDCDDTNPSVNPDGIEIPDNGIDEDCDGMDLLSGVEDAFSAKFKVFPNPTTGKIYLKGDNLRKAKITVTDLTRRILLIEKLNASNEIELPKSAKGMLFLKIETGEGVAVKRVMKF